MNSRKKVKNSRSKSNEEGSFVRNMTSRMTTILSSTITKWFSSPNSSGANGSAPTADTTDSSTEDESIEIQQPAKRICYDSTSGKFDLYAPSVESNCINNSELTDDSCTSHTTILSPPGKNTFRKESNYASTPVLSNSEDLYMENNERKKTLAVPKSPTVCSVGIKRKSLFSNGDESTSNTEKKQKLPIKPSFVGSPFYPGRTMYGGASSSYINQPYIRQPKVTIINKNHENIDNTLSHASKHIMGLLEQYSCPLTEAQRISTSFINNTSNTKAMSSKAQELQIPRYASLLQLKKRSRIMDSTSAARQLIASYSSTKHSVISESNTKDESKSKCTFKIKNKLTRSNRGDDFETLASPPLNLPKCTLNIDLNKLPTFTLGNAVDTKSLVNSVATKKTEIISSSSSQSNNQNRISSNILETNSYNGKSLNSSEMVKSSIFKFSNPLTIDDITVPFTPPKFVFLSPERSFDKSNESMPEVKAIESNLEKLTNSSSESNVLISQIVKKSISESEWQCSGCSLKNKNSVETCTGCSSAKTTNKHNNASEINTNLTVPLSGFTSILRSQREKWECSNCLVRNDNDKTKCLSCETEKPGENKDVPKCTFKLGVSNSSGFKSIINSQSEKWECSSCLVRNDNDKTKCLCCGTEKPGENKDVPKGTFKFDVNNTSGFKSIINSQSEKWECSSCLVRNDKDKTKCLSCETEKPGENKVVPKNTFKFGVSNTSGFKSIINSQSDKWECSSCLVRNDNDKTKCVCCETEKPGEKKDVSKSTFKFGISDTSGFKNIINSQSEKWECSSCLVRNDNDKTKCVCCETEKPGENKDVPKSTFKFGVSNTSSFKSIINSQNEKWECSSCLVRNDNDKTKCLTCETEKPRENKDVPKSSFKFGVMNTSGFKSIINSQSEKWECSSCCVRNDNDKTKCVCCEKEKPGEKKDVAESTPNFDVNDTSFKFGITSKAQGTLDIKNTESVIPSNTSQTSETNNNIMLKTTTLKFAAPIQKVESEKESVKDKPDTPKSDFTFDISKQSAETLDKSQSRSVFSKVSQSIDSKNAVEKEKLQGGIDISRSDTDVHCNNSSPVFTIPFITKSNIDKSISTQPSPPVSNTTTLVENKYELTNPVTLHSALTTPIQLQNTFNLSEPNNPFSVATLTPSYNTTFSSSVPSISSTGVNSISVNAETGTSLLFSKPVTSSSSSASASNSSTTTSATNPTSSVFSFGNNTQVSQSQTVTNIPKFSFSFGADKANTTIFKPTFGSDINKSNTSKFTILPDNTLGSKNLFTVNSNSDDNAITGNTASGNILPTTNVSGILLTNPLIPNSTIQSSNNAQGTCTTGLLNTTINKENTWTPNNISNDLFTTNTMLNSSQKPAFNFGSSTTFRSGNIGGFSTNVTSPSNMFSISNQNTETQSSLFSNAAPVQPTNLFGSQTVNNSSISLGTFSTPNPRSAPTFVAPNSLLSSFEGQPLSSAPGQTFNFGASQPSTMFGFGQQLQTPSQQNQQAQPQGMYNFGASVSAPSQVQFSLGSGPNTAVRRMRKAVRRNPQR